MIECSLENVWYKRKNKSVKRKGLFAVLFIIILFISFYKFVIIKNVNDYCNNYLTKYYNDTVNKVIGEGESFKEEYENIVKIEKDANGDVSLITTNSLNVNRLSRTVCLITNEYLSKQLKKGVPVPFFAFIGLDVLSGIGFNVNIKNLQVSSVNCQLESEFISVGINQTLHSVYVNVISKIDVNLPFSNYSQTCSSRFMLCESIIVGKVPNVYLNKNI